LYEVGRGVKKNARKARLWYAHAEKLRRRST
jgi:TPR repeat protein